ncbi:helix-turn-helix transcriptional regulator [Kitasatospora cineracea]|uniref:helix-turn-helix domain-containing protein n=1 Tax=Kitasatospora cineracea TaxID=88074 RepID=UPI0034143089
MPHPDDLLLQAARREVGANIRRFRASAALTLEQVGARVGRDRRTISSWEHGATAPGLDDLTLLARALGVESWRLLYG